MCLHAYSLYVFSENRGSVMTPENVSWKKVGPPLRRPAPPRSRVPNKR
jgi:hypothetical protein